MESEQEAAGDFSKVEEDPKKVVNNSESEPHKASGSLEFEEPEV